MADPAPVAAFERPGGDAPYGVARPGIGPERITGRIVEVEAYIGEADRASHARFGRTRRNAPMYGEPGRAYLYLVYGMHTCLNVVTEPSGRPAAVLIRAVELLDGAERARALRQDRAMAVPRRLDPEAHGRIARRIAAIPVPRLAAGPGLIGSAFGLRPEMTGLDLCDDGSWLRLEPPPPTEPTPRVVATPRIGIAYAGPPWTVLPWRLAIAGHRSVSGPRGRA